MFDTLKDMLNVPVVIKPFASRDSGGEISFKSDINTFCLPDYRQTFINKRHALSSTFGREEVSDITLYIDASIDIADEDHIVFEGEQYFIKGISATYENGQRSLWAVQI